MKQCTYFLMNKTFCTILALYTTVFVSALMISAPATAQDEQTEYECIPAIRIVADLGYCFGFTVSYFEAVGHQDILDAIKERRIEHNIKTAHQQCYATGFTNQKNLGTLAFSSYINLADDTLLRQTGDDCRLLMNYYAEQNNRRQNTSANDAAE